MKLLLQGARTLSPYLLVELLLPGGTLIALLLWLFQHWKKQRASDLRLFRRKFAVNGQIQQGMVAPAHR
ncbi:MAG TPA: hypothetical protein VFR66_08050 [Burkholderiales bacterium]|nr:hypothetical protein [Burkholderiales bacterium]